MRHTYNSSIADGFDYFSDSERSASTRTENVSSSQFDTVSLGTSVSFLHFCLCRGL